MPRLLRLLWCLRTTALPHRLHNRNTTQAPFATPGAFRLLTNPPPPPNDHSPQKDKNTSPTIPDISSPIDHHAADSGRPSLIPTAPPNSTFPHPTPLRHPSRHYHHNLHHRAPVLVDLDLHLHPDHVQPRPIPNDQQLFDPTTTNNNNSADDLPLPSPQLPPSPPTAKTLASLAVEVNPIPSANVHPNEHPQTHHLREEPLHATTTGAHYQRATWPRAPATNTTSTIVDPPHTQGVEQTARQVFLAVMNALAHDFGDHLGAKPFVFPREIIFVNGAPGAGKSKNSKFILEARGLSTPPIIMSDLLARSPRHRQAMDAGDLISDQDVVEVLFRELLLPKYAQGVLVDGFPRTALQADCMHLLRDKMKQLRATKIHQLKAMGHYATPQNVPYPVPRFFVCILHVPEDVSIDRQMQRGQCALAHNAKVNINGIGNSLEVRETDLDESKARSRYLIFVKHRNTLAKLKENFNYTEIDASSDIKHVQGHILKQFQYQSRQDLSKQAFDTIQPIPLASRIGMNARSYLVQRIEEYISFYPERFSSAVELVIRVFIPKLQSAGFAGRATVRIPPESSDYATLSRVEESCFKQMILDSLAERGYSARYDVEELLIPSQLDLSTGLISCTRRVTHLFHVEFPQARLSNMLQRSLNENRENQEPIDEQNDV